MPFPDVIEFLPLAACDSSRLIVLKSQYNRFAARLNAARLRPYGQEERELLVQLQYLREQIGQYLQ
jgi:hypothetical protein